MAEIGFGLALAVGSQSALGTINATVQALAGALGITNGILLGDASGTGESGFDFAVAREARDQADVSLSFTAQPATFLRRTVETFTIALQLKGAGTVALAGLAASPVVDGDLDISVNYPGLYALLRASGWVGAADAGATDAFILTPEDAVPFTAKLWSGQGSNAVASVLMDCIVNSLSIDFTPGEVAVATFECQGTVVSQTGGTTAPTLTFGHIASISAPTLISAGHSFGIGAAARDFESLTLTISQEVEETGASNSPTGKRQRQTRRRITFDAVILADTGDDDFEEALLATTSAPTADLIFNLWGPTAAAVAPSGEVRSLTIEVLNVEIKRIAEAKVGSAKARQISGQATGPTAESEARIIFI